MIIEVQTTQNVTIDYETAGVGQRLVAYIVDIIAIVIWVIGWIWILSFLSKVGLERAFDGDLTAIFFIIVIFFPVILYDFLFETFNNGQSLGKMALKIKVINLDGTAPTTGSYMVRWLFRLVDFTLTEGFLAIIMVAVTKKSQRLGDYLAGTTVIDLKSNFRNKSLSLSDLDFQVDYKVSYPDILDRLSDKDIQTIRSIIEDPRMRDNDYFNQRLADRIKTITGYTYDGPDRVFLRRIISDYNFLALQEY
ncbi:MAG: RDD family protein [Dysgonomonas sp.]|nr:RDD family protein [Dysgonomonas sp.]